MRGFMYSLESRVRYSEVNSERELALTALLDYLQDCCSMQSEDYGVGVDYLEQAQAFWVLSSWQIKILRYPRLGDVIKVSTWPYGFKGFYGYRNFMIEDQNGQTIAKANSLWVYMDAVSMRPTRVSEYVLGTYEDKMEEALSGDWEDRKIVLPGHMEEKCPIQVPHYFIDTNYHMNNGKYVLAAQEYLPKGFEVSGLRAEYKKAAVLGDILYPLVCEEDGKVTVVLANEGKTPYAVIQFLGIR